MNSRQRILAVLTGVAMLITSAILFLMPEDGIYIVAIILAATLLLIGGQLLIYYCTMARRMVGGKSVLLIGVFLVDFGVFTVTLFDEPGIIVILYLVGWYAFSGVVDILRAAEAFKHKGAWRLKACSGIIYILVAVGCMFNTDNQPMLTLIYSAGLFFSAITRIISAFRKTEIVYIQ